MKPLRDLTLLFILVLLPSLGKAGVELVAETRVFHVPDRGPRVEVNMAFIAGTMMLAPNEHGFNQARVETITIIEQNGEVKAFSKVELQGNERLDSLQGDLVHQEFFELPPGEYDLSIEARDLNSPD